MELVGARQAAEAREQQAVGQVAAAKDAAVGTADAGAQAAAQAAGEQLLEQRARHGTAAAAGVCEPARLRRQQAEEGAAGEPRQAVEAAARAQDRGASTREQEEAAERALQEAEEQEAARGNIWARALGAAATAAGAAAVAAAATKGFL